MGLVKTFLALITVVVLLRVTRAGGFFSKEDDDLDYLDSVEKEIQKRDTVHGKPYRRPIFDLIISILDNFYSTTQSEQKPRKTRATSYLSPNTSGL